MRVKDILRIKSTGELCVDEGFDVSVSSATSQVTKHVRIINPNNYELTSVTYNINSMELEVYLTWDGFNYVSPTR